MAPLCPSEPSCVLSASPGQRKSGLHLGQNSHLPHARATSSAWMFTLQENSSLFLDLWFFVSLIRDLVPQAGELASCFAPPTHCPFLLLDLQVCNEHLSFLLRSDFCLVLFHRLNMGESQQPFQGQSSHSVLPASGATVSGSGPSPSTEGPTRPCLSGNGY